MPCLVRVHGYNINGVENKTAMPAMFLHFSGSDPLSFPSFEKCDEIGEIRGFASLFTMGEIGLSRRQISAEISTVLLIEYAV